MMDWKLRKHSREAILDTIREQFKESLFSARGALCEVSNSAEALNHVNDMFDDLYALIELWKHIEGCDDDAAVWPR